MTKMCPPQRPLSLGTLSNFSSLVIWWTEDPEDRRPPLPRVEREK
jgi:hypothetical protein